MAPCNKMISVGVAVVLLLIVGMTTSAQGQVAGGDSFGLFA